MGSTKKATVLAVIAASSAAASPKGTMRLKPGVNGSEAVAGGRIGAEADDRQSAAVEIVGADDDFGPVLRHPLNLIAPFARNLDRAFHRFGTRVHGQNLVRIGGSAEFFAEQRELVVHESPRRDSKPRRLFDQCREDAGVAVPLIDRRIGRKAIEIAAAIDIPNPNAEATGEHHIKWRVVARAILSFKRAVVDARRRREDLLASYSFAASSRCSMSAKHYSAARSTALASTLWWSRRRVIQ